MESDAIIPKPQFLWIMDPGFIFDGQSSRIKTQGMQDVEKIKDLK